MINSPHFQEAEGIHTELAAAVSFCDYSKELVRVGEVEVLLNTLCIFYGQIHGQVSNIKTSTKVWLVGLICAGQRQLPVRQQVCTTSPQSYCSIAERIMIFHLKTLRECYDIVKTGFRLTVPANPLARKHGHGFGVILFCSHPKVLI